MVIIIVADVVVGFVVTIVVVAYCHYLVSKTGNSIDTQEHNCRRNIFHNGYHHNRQIHIQRGMLHYRSSEMDMIYIYSFINAKIKERNTRKKIYFD